MSQSPESVSSADDHVGRYQRAWQAFSRMIAEGRSFSGYERNCCFLNTGGREFANISASSGLDFMDDSRAVAVVDWDLDGRLDFWVTNRTAPRVRFLRNNTRNDCRFVALRLRGVTCNRDAIGARVELYLKDQPVRCLVKQLSAGDGYLSQSSKWIHFGLATEGKIDCIVVHWPGAGTQTYRGVDSNRHYELVQGSAVAKDWLPPRAALPQTPSEVAARPNDSLKRTVIVGKVPLPSVEYQNWQGQTVPIANDRGRPLLLNLWSATCGPCLTELAEWTQAADRLRSAGLDIIAITVDPFLVPDDPQSVRSRQALKRIGFRWSAGIAQPDLVQNIELMHHNFVWRRQNLPLPSSFLLDGQGRLAVIYKGPVPVATLLEDVDLLGANPDSRRASAVPFPGRWATKPPVADPEPIVRMLDKLERTDDAVSYARRCLANRETIKSRGSVESRNRLMDLHGVLGEMLLKQRQPEVAGVEFARLLELGDNAAALHRDIGESYLLHNMPADAAKHLSAALEGTRDDAKLLYNLGIAELAARKPMSAIEHLRRSHELSPADTDVCFHLANALHGIGETKEAVTFYRRALELRPGWPFAANNLAWILATHPDASLRDGGEAVRLAETLCHSNDHSDPSSLATLAAAYAEVNRFEEAMRWNDHAAELAREQGQISLSTRLRERAKTLASRQPIRE